MSYGYNLTIGDETEFFNLLSFSSISWIEFTSVVWLANIQLTMKYRFTDKLNQKLEMQGHINLAKFYSSTIENIYFPNWSVFAFQTAWSIANNCSSVLIMPSDSVEVYPKLTQALCIIQTSPMLQF